MRHSTTSTAAKPFFSKERCFKFLNTEYYLNNIGSNAATAHARSQDSFHTKLAGKIIL